MNAEINSCVEIGTIGNQYLFFFTFVFSRTNGRLERSCLKQVQDNKRVRITA